MFQGSRHVGYGILGDLGGGIQHEMRIMGVRAVEKDSAQLHPPKHVLRQGADCTHSVQLPALIHYYRLDLNTPSIHQLFSDFNISLAR